MFLRAFKKGDSKRVGVHRSLSNVADAYSLEGLSECFARVVRRRSVSKIATTLAT